MPRCPECDSHIEPEGGKASKEEGIAIQHALCDNCHSVLKVYYDLEESDTELPNGQTLTHMNLDRVEVVK